ncbi:MAG: M48 family metalloprotease [Alphaproteobacteria bacterium]|nr:M48 family metalloprotease [Alphaproteobacteria bacterium]
MNMFKTFALMLGMFFLFIVVGAVFGGTLGMFVCFLLATALNLWAYWNSDKALLRMYGARQVSEQQAPDLVSLVRQLSSRAGLPCPKVYIMDDPQPNAFATGRNPEHSAVCVTRGLLERMNNYQLAGVLAHELGHIKHRDTLIMTVVATTAGALQMLLSFGARRSGMGLIGVILVSLLAPLAAILVQMAISRSREFEADKFGGDLAGRPLWLASALANLEPAAQAVENVTARRNPATAHMFIVNPLSGARIGKLFSTHPPIADRVERLRVQAGVDKFRPGNW